MPPINLLLIDENHLLVAAVKNVFKNSRKVNVNVSVCSLKSDDILGYLADHKTDVIFLELMMKRRDGFEILKSVKTYYPHIKIIGFSFINRVYFIEKILDMGADGFISKYDANLEIMEQELNRVLALS